MTAVEPAYRCDAAAARTLTDEIKGSVERTYRLLLNAHEWGAWSALGYGSWRDYAMTELGVSQSRAYQLLDTAKVIREIETAAGSSNMLELTQREVDAIKPHLTEVAEAVREAVADVPEPERPAVAAATVRDARERLRPTPAAAPSPVASVTHTTTDKTVEQYDVDRETGEVAPPAVLTVDEWQEQEDTRALDDDLERHLDGTADRFLLSLARGMASCNRLLELAPERVAETCAPGSNDDVALSGFLTRMETWMTSVRAAKAPALRRIK